MSYPQDLEGLLADLHAPGLEHLDAPEVLDGEGTGAGTDGGFVRLPLVRLGAFGYSLFPSAERVPERPPQPVHFARRPQAPPLQKHRNINTHTKNTIDRVPQSIL